MNKEFVKNALNKACDLLYKENKDLIRYKTHERTIVAHIRGYLSPIFKDWDIDTDYNREGLDGDVKRNLNGNAFYPDLIIHKRGSINGPNLVAVQVKGYWNNEIRSKDENDLISLKKKYKYKYLYRIELNPESFELIEVN